MIQFFNPLWKRVVDDLIGKYSVLVHAPRGYGKAYFLESLAQNRKFTAVCRLIYLLIDENERDEDAVYAMVYDQIMKQFAEVNWHFSGNARKVLIEAIVTIRSNTRPIFVIQSSKRNRKNCALIISAFQDARFLAESFNQFNVLVLDDYTIHFYENEVNSGISKWEFNRYYFKNDLDEKYISLFLQTKGFNNAECLVLLPEISRLTGGHEGLILEILADFSRHKADMEFFRNPAGFFKVQIMQSALLDTLRSSLLNNDRTEEYLKTAYYYKTNKVTPTRVDDITGELYRLGIVFRLNSVYSRLCGGIIQDVLRDEKNRNETQSTTAVVLVHGLGGNAKTWDKMIKIANRDKDIRDNFHIHIYEFPTSIFGLTLRRLPRIQILSEGLRAEINNKLANFSNVVLVAHSLGGLICRKYILDEVQNGNKLKISRLLMFATPNAGASLANIARRIGFIFNIQVQQLCRNKEFISDLNRQWLNRNIDARLTVRVVVGGQDRIVEETSVRNFWTDARVDTIVEANHFTIIKPDDPEHLSYSVFKNFICAD